MEIDSAVRAAAADPERLEQLYRSARQAGRADAFEAAILACYGASPDNVLYAAWFHRLRCGADGGEQQARSGPNWIAAVPLSLMTGLIFWALSDFERLTLLGGTPQLFLWWSPIAAMSALVYLTVTSRRAHRRAAALGLGLSAAAAYVALLAPSLYPAWKGSQFALLGVIHVPLLCWGALGIHVLGLRSSTEDRFAFLIRSIEVAITAGLFLAAGMAFGGITVGMFAALGIDLPEIWLRLVAAGGFGLLPVLAVATTYDPRVSPAAQDFSQGLSRFVATMMRLLLPLTLAVLIVYVVVIPFNFRAPFEDRDVLIVYNLMLFAILGLLLGATPIRVETLSPSLRRWLRAGLLAVAVLVELVSLYALSATVYRTIQGGWTPNRLTIIGWNCINMGILALVLVRLLRGRDEAWVEGVQAAFSLATNAYLGWGAFLLVAVPVLF